MSEVHRSYRINAVAQKEGGRQNAASFKISIPPRMARLVPEEAEFVPEWHDDGILLRRVEAIPVVPEPEWIKAERTMRATLERADEGRANTVDARRPQPGDPSA